MRIGIDVGGTNTDAVLMHGSHVLTSTKTATSPDITSGIARAILHLREQHPHQGSDVQAVMIGTTQLINALVQAKDLARVAALRLGLPSGSSLPPLTAWPSRLLTATAARSYQAHGGHEFDGREISPLHPDELRRHAADMAEHGVTSVAISSVFSPVNDEMEEAAADILRTELGADVAISLSHSIGRVGLLGRENATILNAALRPVAELVVGGLTELMKDLSIDAPLFLSQNDGTLMDLEVARQHPVLTFASGPTNSMRGAALLSGIDDCIVVDIGGTTTDVGVLINGFPRQRTSEVDISQVRTNFRMPDVFSYGLGGGSHVVSSETGVQVGPTSVGFRLTEQALVFGGNTLTATDIAVAAGLADLGDKAAVRHLDKALVDAVLANIRESISACIDRMKSSADDVHVVAVGGGSLLMPTELPGVTAIHRPDHFEVANAVGAAIATVGGESDRVYSMADIGRSQALDDARQQAVDRAVAAGADVNRVRVVDVDEMPLPYLPGNATRVRCRAVGRLALSEG